MFICIIFVDRGNHENLYTMDFSVIILYILHIFVYLHAGTSLTPNMFVSLLDEFPLLRTLVLESVYLHNPEKPENAYVS